MLDIKFIRANPEKVQDGCDKKQVKIDIGHLLEIDQKRRQNLQGLEEMQAQKNKASIIISETKDEQEKQKLILEMQELGKKSEDAKNLFQKLDEEFNDLMRLVPNLPEEGVPIGEDEKNNVVLRQVGKLPKFEFPIKDYLALSESLDLIDIKRAAKISGSRFGCLKKQIVLLEFALVNLALEILTKQGFIPLIPPVMLKAEMARGMGYFEQTDQEEAYYLSKDDLYLVGTSEQSIGPMHAGEVFEEKDLPRRYAAFSTCFRREAGAYGKDTRGILRVHQFDKVEMFSFSKPEDSKKEHQFLLSLEEKLMQILKIPYQIVQLCTGDLSRPAAATYDIESWLPGQNQYRETHSTSNCTDFQARRLNIRYRDKAGQLHFVHTLNGTAFAIGRTLIAIIENYQQKDGSVEVPKILRSFCGFKKIKNR